jgi:hypothetical protein
MMGHEDSDQKIRLAQSHGPEMGHRRAMDKKLKGWNILPAQYSSMVGATGIEPVTPAV